MTPDQLGAERPKDPCGAFVIGPELLARGREGGPLAGRRFAVKDLFDVAGTRTGAGNPAWLAEAPVAEKSAPTVTALLEAGADLWGKTVTDELAFSLSGTNVHYGTPVNTAAPGRVPGGSSAGSASAVAGGLVELALGSDTAGSVRVPASYCGLYSLRPSYGRLDEAGVQPLAPSFDTVGLFAAAAADLEAGWEALVERAGRPFPAPGRGRVRRLVVAEDLFALADPEVRPALAAAARRLAERLGASLSERPLGRPGDLERWRGAFRAIQLVEVWQTHGAWLSTHEPGFGPGVAARFKAAAAADPEEAARARPVRGEVLEALVGLLGDDALLVQPAATGAAPFPEMEPAAKDDLRARLFALTAPVGMAGSPAVALPLASSPDGLPVGLVLVGLPGDDERLVEVAAASSR